MGIIWLKNIKVVQIKLDLEKIAGLVFLLIFLFAGPGVLLGHQIRHDFPYGYFASDSFQHQIRAEAIKEIGNFKYEATYISKGFKNVVGRYPPSLYHIAVIFSNAAGLEAYDAILFIVLFFAVLAIFAMYIIISNLSKNVAILAMPLALLIFSYPAYIGFTWGHWPSLMAQFFIIAFAWCLMRMDLPKSYILTSIILASIALIHSSEAFFAVIFLVIFVAAKLLSKNLKKTDVKNILIFSITSFIVCLYYIIIFKNTWAQTQPYKFLVEPTWPGNPTLYMADFGLLLILIIIGIIFALLKLKDLHLSLILGFSMLISGYLNYIGFGLRSFQIRFLWPLYLAVFFGFAVYMLSKFIIKKWNLIYSAALAIILTVLLIGMFKVPLIPQYTTKSSQGLMDQYHWNALEWLTKTEPDSKVYFFYGDIYSQDALLRNSKRVHYQVDPEDFVKALQERKVKRSYISEFPGDSGGGIMIRKGIFKFEDANKGLPEEYFYGPQDMCKFDYLVFDKVSFQQVLAQYNLLIASELLKNRSISKAFENEMVVILKNSKPGDDCIEERSF